VDSGGAPTFPRAGRADAAIPPHPYQRGWAREVARARTVARFASNQSPARSNSGFDEPAQNNSRRGARRDLRG
jgi:hypothetical protein